MARGEHPIYRGDFSLDMADGHETGHYELAIGTDTERGAKAAKVVGDILRELERAMRKHPNTCPSAHHAFAVLQEEVEEMWADVKKDNLDAAKIEAVQVVAMAIRFLLEVK